MARDRERQTISKVPTDDLLCLLLPSNREIIDLKIKMPTAFMEYLKRPVNLKDKKTLAVIMATILLLFAIPPTVYVSLQQNNVRNRAAATVTTDYYVSPSGSDGNSGTSASSPFKTIQKVFDIVQPGDTINLAAGGYLQDVITKTAGTSTAPIIVTGPATAVIKGGGAARVFEVDHNYYVLSGFTLDGQWGAGTSATDYRDKLLYVMGTQVKSGVTGLK